MHQSSPPVSFILCEDKTEKDRQPQEGQSGPLCALVVTDVCF